MTPVHDGVGRRSIYQNVELFIMSKTNIRNVAIFKYSLALVWRNHTAPKIPINLSHEKNLTISDSL